MPERILAKSTKNIGAITLIKPVMDALGIRETVDRYSPMERSRGITHGQAIETLILNRLTSPTPLYHVEEWASLYALEEAYGIDADQVNDDRLARALEKRIAEWRPCSQSTCRYRRADSLTLRLAGQGIL